MLATEQEIKRWIYTAAKKEFDSPHSIIRNNVAAGFKVLDHARNGETVYQITNVQDRLTQQQMYRQLVKYHKKGVITMHKHYVGAMCCWWYDGLLAELVGGDRGD